MKDNKDLLINYQNLAISVLRKALDDICPIDILDNKHINLKVEMSKIKNRNKKFLSQERKLDDEWRSIEKEYINRFNNFLNERAQALEKINMSRNTEEKKENIERYKQKRDTSVVRIIEKLNKDKIFYSKRNEKKKENIRPKLKELEEIAFDKIEKSKERYNRFINNALHSINDEHIDKKLEQAKFVWSKRAKGLSQKADFRVATYNHKRIERDQIRLAIEWFVYDLPKVNFWCLLAGVPLLDCYEAVKNRLSLIDRESLEIDDLIARIKAGEFAYLKEGFQRGNMKVFNFPRKSK